MKYEGFRPISSSPSPGARSQARPGARSPARPGARSPARWRFTTVGRPAALQRAERALATVAEEVSRGVAGFGNYEIEHSEVAEAANASATPGDPRVPIRRVPLGALMLPASPGAHVAVRISMRAERSGERHARGAAPGAETGAVPETGSGRTPTPCEYVTLYGAPAWAPADLPTFAGLAPGEPRRA